MPTIKKSIASHRIVAGLIVFIWVVATAQNPITFAAPAAARRQRHLHR